MTPELAAHGVRKKCTHSNCTCNCCDPRNGKHCHRHDRGCHLDCPG